MVLQRYDFFWIVLNSFAITNVRLGLCMYLSNAFYCGIYAFSYKKI